MSRRLPSWLDAYLAYSAESESPEEFHLWCAISAVAAVMRRQVFFDMGYFILYPNLYIVLVGPPGRVKKSTAMRMARGIASQVPGVDFSVDSTTRERLIQDMAQSYKDAQSALTVHSTEFASLLTSSGMDMVVFLTDIFDCPNEWTHKTKSGGTNKIKSPFLNLVGATTPDWIAKAMPLDTIGIGLTSRVVFIYADEPRERDPFPKLSPAQQALQTLLVDDLAAISTLNGEFKFDEEAEELYRIWYRARFRDPNPSGDPRLSGYYERKPMHLIKLCMIVSASKRDDLTINSEDFVQSCKMFDKVEKYMTRVFIGVGKNPLYADQEEILATIIDRDEGFTIGDILDRFSYSVRKEEVAEIVDTLQTIGKIKFSNGRFYATGRVPEGTKGITHNPQKPPDPTIG